MLIKYGLGVADARGSAGGVTASRNKSGAYFRARVKPVNPKSTRQEAARTYVAFFAQRWHEDLTVVQRGLWETYAAAVTMKNGLGETIHLSGYNQYMRTNCVGSTVPLGNFDDAPTILSLAEQDPTLVFNEEDIAAQTLTFTFSNQGWAPNGDPKGRMMLYQGQPQLVSRQTYHGPFRYIGVVDPIAGAAGTQTLAAGYSFALGQKVWCRARIFTTTGRVSEVWQADPRTIEADP